MFPLIHLMLQAQGHASATPAEQMGVADVETAYDYLKPFVDSGHIRAFRGNAYLQDFGSGDTWAAQVWSGDLASSGGKNDVFVYPEEGAMIWTDNMLIPKGAQNQYTAELMMDWVYDVDRAARLANFIYYISPVKGVERGHPRARPGARRQRAALPAGRCCSPGCTSSRSTTRPPRRRSTSYSPS